MRFIQNYIYALIFLTLTISHSFAGGLEVSRQNNMLLLSKDKVFETVVRQTSASVKDNVYSAFDGKSVIKQLNLVSAGYKSDYSDSISYAVEVYEPMASTLQYPTVVRIKALLRSQAISLTGKYQSPNSPIGLILGTRYLTIKRSTLNIGTVDLITTPTSELGYMAGISYEKPEIALKVLLTYSPAIDLTLPITVVSTATAKQAAMTTLDFETGIAKDTLLYGSIHQSSWKSAQISLNGVGQISSFTDSDKYNIGVGRKFSEKLSGSVSYTSEPGGSATGTSLLSPTNGTDTYGLGVKYKTNFGDITFGYALSSFGDKAVTSSLGTGNFKNNDASTIGLKASFKIN